MKINKLLFDKMKMELDKVINDPNFRAIIDDYEAGRFSRSSGCNNLQMRFCWDMWYLVPQQTRIPLMNELYKTVNDDHIFTALKKILPSITKRY